ncbi:Cleavage and polyadenylation specificity factor subunit 1 [Dinochytrium kinnereticum]|nr:Cleavage and polyadenylation specificity factor subunit 1 [Dinochytrium kinnereticum]
MHAAVGETVWGKAFMASLRHSRWNVAPLETRRCRWRRCRRALKGKFQFLFLVMYAAWKEVHPPTAVEACLEARFTSPDAVNLIVSKAHILQVYNVVEVEEEVGHAQQVAKVGGADVDIQMANGGGEGVNGERSGRTAKVARLELAGEFRMNGNITSMVTVRTSTSVGLGGMDSLLLSFRDAKMALIEYSRSQQTIVTVSMHYYEREEFKKEIMTDKSIPEVRMDPQFRCGALSFYGDRLAILPFKQDAGMQAEVDDATSKYPFLPSFVMPTNAIDVKLRNIVDFGFLYGFVEPTLAILYETTQTWTGRLAGRRDTRALVVISVDTSMKAFPIIFHIQQIPYNAYKIIPVPLPIGGVLIVCTNSIIHVDQTSVPGIACAVNKFYGLEVNLPTPPVAETLGPTTRKDNPLYHSSNVIDYKHLALSLEGSEAVFVNPDTLMMVLRSGEMLMVELVGHDDGTGWRRRKGGLKEFKLTRLGIRAMMPFCACRIGGGGDGLARALGGLGGVGQGFTPQGTSIGYIFLGSRVADSLLIQVKEHDVFNNPSQETSSKRQPMDIDDDDDDDIYGDSSLSRSNSTSVPHNGGVSIEGDGRRFQLRVCDSLFGTGPIRDMAIGESAKYFEDAYTPSVVRKDLEIVACLGEGADGALGVFQKNVRPKILTTVELPQVQDVWAVRCTVDGKEGGYHDYLVMSEEYKTTVLQTGEELQEVQDTDFYSSGTTVTAASILGNRFVIQVHPNGASLKAGKKVQDSPIGNHDQWIVSSSVLDPYIILLMNDGDMILLRVDEDTREILIVHETKDQSISACCIYIDDKAGKYLPFIDELQKTDMWRWDSSTLLATSPALQPTASGEKVPSGMDLDLDEDDLYGGDEEKKQEVPSKPSVYSVPDFQLVFSTPHFSSFPNVVHDHIEVDEKDMETRSTSDLNEVLVINMGPHETRRDPYLMARTITGDLIIYRIFTYLETFNPTHGPKSAIRTSPHSPQESLPHRLSIRLVRVPHDHFSRDLKTYKDTDGDKLQPLDTQPQKTFVKRHYLRPFSQIIGSSPSGSICYMGVMMTGPKPCWIMAATEGLPLKALETLDPIYGESGSGVVGLEESLRQKGKRVIRVHPCTVDGGMRTFTEFHNVNVENGFVYVTETGLLRLCQLPWQFNYDTDWPFCKVNLRRTPQKVTYHYDSETYVIAASTPTPFRMSKAQHAAAMAAGVIEEGETLDIVRESSKEDRSGMYYPSIGSFNIELVSPVTWETVDRYEFQEYEQVLTCQAVSLHSKQTTSGQKLFLAVGTGWFRGEDLSVRGRFLLFDIIDVVPEIDNPQTNHKLKVLYTNEEKSPITAICAVNGYLLAAIGSRIIMHSFEDNESLSGVAFFDVNVYVNTLTSVKNMILVGDVMKSMLFLGFQEEPPQLKLLGKDYHSLQVHAANYLIDESSISFTVSDSDSNLHLMNYAPYNIQSESGQKLIRRGELHAGSRVQSIVRLRKTGVRDPRTGDVTMPKQYWNVCGMLDGNIGYLVPVSEKLYKRAYALYSKMVNSLQHHAGLNPRGFRQLRHRNRPLSTSLSSGPPGPRFILDGDILCTYLSLSVEQQKELANAVGSTIERNVDDVLEAVAGTDFF